MKILWRSLFFLHVLATIAAGLLTYWARNSMSGIFFGMGLFWLDIPWSAAAGFFPRAEYAFQAGFLIGPFLFVVTGTFRAGSRAEVVGAIASRGGLVQKDATQATHYLVVGTLGSERWVHGSSGRKIEKAIALRTEGRGIAIVSEAAWASQL